MILIVGILIFLTSYFLLKKKGNGVIPEPEPEPEPKPKWEDYYPKNSYMPLIDKIKSTEFGKFEKKLEQEILEIYNKLGFKNE